MKQLLIRADDLGYSYAVNVGIARTVHEGLVRSVGIMPNMPEAARGWSWIRDAGVAVGVHANVCLGHPCADPALVSSLLTPEGVFRSSREYRAAWAEGTDFVRYDDAVAELEAQLACFVEVTGSEPDYFEAHAVESESLNRAVEDVARAHGYRFQAAPFDTGRSVTCGSTPVRMVMRSMVPGYDPASAIREVVEQMADGETVVFVCHPGYLDQAILRSSSLTEDRTKEVDALIDPELRSWLEVQSGIRLVDYRDL